ELALQQECLHQYFAGRETRRRAAEEASAMISDIGHVSSIQRDGRGPTVEVAGAALGESGVAVMRLHYRAGAHFDADRRQPVVSFAPPGPFPCRVAGKTLQPHAVEGGVAVFPAGIDTAADCDRDIRTLLIAIDPGRFALASAEDGADRPQL